MDHLGRAEELLRRGEIQAASGELDRCGPEPRSWLLRAQLALLRNDPDAAAECLERAHPSDLAGEAERAELEAVRLLVIGELAGAEKAARASWSLFLRTGKPAPASLLALRVAILVLLDELDAARSLLDRPAELSRAMRSLLESAWALRAGLLTASLTAGHDAEAALGLAGDPTMRALAAYVRSRAAHQLGRLDDAEHELRLATGLASDRELALVSELSEVARMLLSATRGDWRSARAAAGRLLEASTLRPLALAEAGWSRDDDAELAPPWPATFALRRAERWLTESELARADEEAGRAEQFFRQAGAAYDRTFSLLVRAEAQARLGHADRARHLLDACEARALAGDYRLVLVRGSLVRAHACDRAGDISGYVAALDSASRHAGTLLASAALDEARTRAGLPASGAPAAEGQPWRDVVRRLGLARPGRWFIGMPGRTYITDDDEWPKAAVRVDLVERTIRAGRRRASWPQHFLELAAVIGETGDEGIDVETLYRRGWTTPSYHPLRNRNTVYVGVARLRELLARLGAGTVVRDGDGRYHLTAGPLAVRRPRPPRWSPLFGRQDRPDDCAAYACEAGISLAQARWELALCGVKAP